MKKTIYIFTLLLTLQFTVGAQVQPDPKTKTAVEKVKFYPNPAVNFIVLEFEEKPIAAHSVYIFNFLGKKVIEEPLSQGKNTINLMNLYRGMYIFQIRDLQGKIVDSGKFQIAR